jgi:RNA polymerase sigma factor (sigma-70 family)
LTARIDSRQDTGDAAGRLIVEPLLVTGSILGRIAAGERAAVQECLDSYGGLVWSLARRLSPNQADAEDAVQEIFIDLWKSAGRFDESRASEPAFVAMVARRRLIDRHRRLRRAPATEEIPDGLEDPRPTHDKQVELCAEAAAAASAMGELRVEQKTVIQLAIYSGLTHQEIAAKTGMPLGTVKTHLRRGLLHIREKLGVGANGRARESSQ